MTPRNKLWLWVWLFLACVPVACRQPAAQSPAQPALPSAPGSQLTARGAYSLAEKPAQAWNASALLAEILSGDDINERGASDYWEFHFVDPEMQKKFVVVVQAERVKQAQEGRLAGSITPLPADWMDSKPAYQKSVAAFFAHHQDPASFQPGWLSCDSRNFSTPHWTMLFSQPKHLPVGSMIDAASGDYLGEINR